jgi:hypothetical protein
MRLAMSRVGRFFVVREEFSGSGKMFMEIDFQNAGFYISIPSCYAKNSLLPSLRKIFQ